MEGVSLWGDLGAEDDHLDRAQQVSMTELTELEDIWGYTINGRRAPLQRTRTAHRALAVAEAFVCGMD